MLSAGCSVSSLSGDESDCTSVCCRRFEEPERGARDASPPLSSASVSSHSGTVGQGLSSAAQSLCVAQGLRDGGGGAAETRMSYPSSCVDKCSVPNPQTQEVPARGSYRPVSPNTSPHLCAAAVAVRCWCHAAREE